MTLSSRYVAQLAQSSVIGMLIHIAASAPHQLLMAESQSSALCLSTFFLHAAVLQQEQPDDCQGACVQSVLSVLSVIRISCLQRKPDQGSFRSYFAHAII